MNVSEFGFFFSGILGGAGIGILGAMCAFSAAPKAPTPDPWVEQTMIAPEDRVARLDDRMHITENRLWRLERFPKKPYIDMRKYAK